VTKNTTAAEAAAAAVQKLLGVFAAKNPTKFDSSDSWVRGLLLGNVNAIQTYIKLLEEKSLALCDALYGEEEVKLTTASDTQSAEAKTKDSTKSTPVETLLDDTIQLVKQFRSELDKQTKAIAEAEAGDAITPLKVTNLKSIWPTYTYTIEDKKTTVAGNAVLKQAAEDKRKQKSLIQAWQAWKASSESPAPVPTTPTPALSVDDCINLSEQTVYLFNNVNWARPATMTALKQFFTAKKARFLAQRKLALLFTKLLSDTSPKSAANTSDEILKQMAQEAKVLMGEQGKEPADMDKLDNAFAQTFGDSTATCEKHLTNILDALEKKQT
jgi:hypothetical protein